MKAFKKGTTYCNFSETEKHLKNGAFESFVENKAFV